MSVATEAAGFDAVAVARGLQPTLRERAEEVEQARQLPEDLSAELARAGLYRLWVPREFGGLDQALLPAMRALELLAQADGSVAWNVFIAITSSSVLDGLPEASAREIFAEPETLLVGVFAPEGRADAVAGGFRVRGRWAFGSGTPNADWICAGCRFFREGEPIRGPGGGARQHMVIVPASQVHRLDTWQVSGLCGTGSHDFLLEDVEVPEDRVVGWQLREARRPLARFPQFTLLAAGIGPIALGLARAAVDELSALAVEKQPTGSRRPLAARADVQAGVARAEASLAAARAYLYEVAEAGWCSARDAARVSLEERRDIRLAVSHATETAARVVSAMYALAGSSAIHRSSPLQRIFRDVHVVTQHIMVRPTVFELAGRVFLGSDKDSEFL